MIKKTLALAILTLCVSATTHARTDDKTKPVILLHGWGTGYDCGSYFGTIISELKAQGFTGPIVTVGYYKNDSNCTVNLQDMDSSVSDDTPWRALGASFSRYINQTYISTGQVVDILGHSMGGLIMRSAIQGSQEQAAGYAPMMVEDAVTMGTPHVGTNLSSFCGGQCYAMARTNSDFKWTASNGNPQSLVATDWTVIGSSTDELVAISSALSMDIDSNHSKRYFGLGHLGMLKSSAAVSRAIDGIQYGAQ